MGLTIHYKLSVAENLDLAVVRELAARTRLYAQRIGCAEVSEIFTTEGDPKLAPLFVRVGAEEDCCFGCVPPKRGWLVSIWPGEGCESAVFGLCQYPRRVPFQLRGGRGFAPTGFHGGWMLQSCCKTQYAGEPGWAHFLKCHKLIVSILDFWRQLGVTVEVTDEGEFWQTRSEATLKLQLQKYDGLVAAVGGMLKDGGAHVESPVFDYANFERLEHEGQMEFGRRLEQLRSRRDLKF